MSCVLSLQKHVNIVIVECHLDSVRWLSSNKTFEGDMPWSNADYGLHNCVPGRAARRYERTNFVSLRGHPIKSHYQMNVYSSR